MRVLIADDHAIFRRGLVELLSEVPGLTVVGEASNGIEAERLCSKTRPDLVLMDIHMPGRSGIEALSAIKKRFDIPVIMLTVSDKDADLFKALKAGADGYLLKNVQPEALVAAIQQIQQGQAALSPEVLKKVMRAASHADLDHGGVHLSDRELEVLRALAQGASTFEIAQQLVISPNTVKTHIRNLLKKLGASSRAEAVARATSLGILSPD